MNGIEVSKRQMVVVHNEPLVQKVAQQIAEQKEHDLDLYQFDDHEDALQHIRKNREHVAALIFRVGTHSPAESRAGIQSTDALPGIKFIRAVTDFKARKGKRFPALALSTNEALEQPARQAGADDFFHYHEPQVGQRLNSKIQQLLNG